VSGMAWNGLGPRIQGKGFNHQEPRGNCVVCRKRIAFGEEYKRVAGILGKVCLECFDEHS
jgi:hypothetical protein